MSIRLKRIQSEQNKEPDITVPVELPKPKSYNEKLSEILGNNDIRKDGRALVDHRPVYMKTEVSTEARGSSYVEMGKTKLICTVQGPVEVNNLHIYAEEGFINVDFKFAPFSCPEFEGTSKEGLEKMMGYRLSKIMDSVLCKHEFPNYQVSANIVVLESDGACYAASVIAANLAFADARLPMFDLASAVTVGVHSDMVITDLTLAEEKFCVETIPDKACKEHGILSVAYMPSLDQITDYNMRGALSGSQLDDLLKLCIENCKALTKLQQQVLAKDIKIALADKNSTLNQQEETPLKQTLNSLSAVE